MQMPLTHVSRCGLILVVGMTALPSAWLPFHSQRIVANARNGLGRPA